MEDKKQPVTTEKDETTSKEKLNEETQLKVCALYLDEWKHRDNMLIKHMFTYFWASIVVSLLPYFSFVQNILGDRIEIKVFHYVGIVIAILAFVISYLLGIREMLVSKKYDLLLEGLNKNYKHLQMKEFNKIEKRRRYLSLILPLIIFVVIIAMNIILIFLSADTKAINTSPVKTDEIVKVEATVTLTDDVPEE